LKQVYKLPGKIKAHLAKIKTHLAFTHIIDKKIKLIFDVFDDFYKLKNKYTITEVQRDHLHNIWSKKFLEYRT